MPIAARIASVLIALLFSVGVARAELMSTLPAIPAVQLDQPSLLEAHHARYRAIVMRNAGIVTTVVAAVATVAGAALFTTSLCFYDNGNCPNSTTARFASSATLLAVGQLGIVAGITLWSFGGHHKGDAERKILALSAGGARLTF